LGYGHELSDLDESVEAVFLGSEESQQRFAIESVDGLLLYVHSPRAVEGDRVTVVVEDLRGAADFELTKLRGSTLSLARGATLAPELPLNCRAVLSDGKVANLRVSGVRYAGQG
jgi:hypothetical protein